MPPDGARLRNPECSGGISDGDGEGGGGGADADVTYTPSRGEDCVFWQRNESPSSLGGRRQHMLSALEHMLDVGATGLLDTGHRLHTALAHTDALDRAWNLLGGHE